MHPPFHGLWGWAVGILTGALAEAILMGCDRGRRGINQPGAAVGSSGGVRLG